MTTPQDHADRLLSRLRTRPAGAAQLAADLGVSRGTLEAALDELEERGYVLGPDSEGRYRLESIPDLLLTDEIEAALGDLPFGRPLHTYGRVGSTNRVAAQLAAAGAPEGTLVTAEEQTQGRGRHGRTWHSPPGVGIWMSLILRPELSAAAAAGLPLVAALAVARALRARAGVDARIKWPNDVFIEDRKVAGVLGESAVEGPTVLYTVMGMGINVNQVQEDIPEDLQSIAGSLAIATGQRWPRVSLVAEVLAEFETRYRAYCGEGFTCLADEFRSSSTLIGRAVHVDTADGTISGTVVDLDPEGALLLATAAGTRAIRVGDATLRLS